MTGIAVEGFTLRRYRPDDAALLAELLRESVNRLGPDDYHPDQVAAWAARLPDAAAMALRCIDGRSVWVAEVAGSQLLGFTDLEPDGHIDMLYVAPMAKGQGVAAALTDALIAHARAAGHTQLHVEASEAARRFYEKMGFTTRHRRDMDLGGVAIHNWAMLLDLR